MLSKRITLVIILSLIFVIPNFAQVGIGTIAPKSTLDINGNLSVKVVNLNGGPGGSATPINDGVYISLTPTVGNVEFLLPNATAVPGRVYILRNVTDFETAQIYSLGGLFFSKQSKTATSAPLNMPPDALRKSVIIASDGFNWTYFD